MVRGSTKKDNLSLYSFFLSFFFLSFSSLSLSIFSLSIFSLCISLSFFFHSFFPSYLSLPKNAVCQQMHLTILLSKNETNDKKVNLFWPSRLKEGILQKNNLNEKGKEEDKVRYKKRIRRMSTIFGGNLKPFRMFNLKIHDDIKAFS